MSSAVAELDNYLQSMLALKPPGVSGSKINSITSLCTANVQVLYPFVLGLTRAIIRVNGKLTEILSFAE